MLGDSRNAHLGRYELIARLATGGMGEIFLARLEGAAGFEKLYVVKRILPHLAGDGHFRTMLIDEARIASKLSHPSICQVYELGETDGELYIVMEYLEGVTLLPLLRYAARQGRPLELGMVACVISQVTEALHYAHELRDRDGTFLNIIHRDVTPSNIVITESGVAKVLDFGIAKAKNVSTETQTGTVKGKHAYMAPEQLRGQIIDRRVDVYAVGVLLYEMLALRRLFQRRTDYLTLQAVMEHPVPDIRTFRPDASSALSAALARALHRDRAERYETVRQLGAAVSDAIAAQDRVWTPSQLGEQLGARFSLELRRRSAAVAAAIARTPEAPRPGQDPLARVPPVQHDEDDALEGAYDADLPSVDSAVQRLSDLGLAQEPGFESHAHTRVDRAFPRDPATRAPMSGPVDSLQALAERPAPALARRPWIWPALAGLLLAVAAGALVVLWQSRQKAQTVLVLTDRRDSAATAGQPGAAGAAGTTGTTGSDQGTSGASPEAVTPAPPDAGPAAPPPPDAGARPAPAPKDSRSVLRARISALSSQMSRCLGEHPVTTAIEGAVELQIEPTGKVSKVEISPATLAATPLAGCIKRLFGAQRFPEQREPLQIRVPFSTKIR